MQFYSSFLLGLVQGLTEFLPISSSGHLVLASHLLNYEETGLLLETVVHIATTLVVIIYFRKRFMEIIRTAIHDGDTRWLILMLILAFTVTSVIGLAMKMSNLIDTSFASPVFAGFMLLVTAAALFSVRRVNPPDDSEERPRVSWKVALFVGLAQGIAVLPGISRSGFTIVSGLWGGMGRNSAAEFSFLLSVPTIAAASLLELALEFAKQGGLPTGDPKGLLVAAAVAFISGLIAIHWLMRWLRRGRLWWFSGYCAVIGVVSVVLFGFNLI